MVGKVKKRVVDKISKENYTQAKPVKWSWNRMIPVLVWEAEGMKEGRCNR